MSDEDDAKAAGKFKALINEVLDERETKAADAKKAADEKAAAEAAAKNANTPKSLIATFLGLN